MAKTMKTCRVCGKEYEACHSAIVKSGAYRWQDVACSPECGAEYLRLILESRGISTSSKKEVHAEHKRRKRNTANVAAPVVNTDEAEG